MFYPPKGRLLADSKGVHLFLLMFYFLLGNVYWTFKKADGICGFWTGLKLEMFYLRVDGWDGWGIKSVLQFSLYFVCIYILYLTSYICSQNLSPTSLWVSKFDVKLGVMIKIFKITAGR